MKFRPRIAIWYLAIPAAALVVGLWMGGRLPMNSPRPAPAPQGMDLGSPLRSQPSRGPRRVRQRLFRHERRSPLQMFLPFRLPALFRQQLRHRSTS